MISTIDLFQNEIDETSLGGTDSEDDNKYDSSQVIDTLEEATQNFVAINAVPSPIIKLVRCAAHTLQLAAEDAMKTQLAHVIKARAVCKK